MQRRGRHSQRRLFGAEAGGVGLSTAGVPSPERVERENHEERRGRAAPKALDCVLARAGTRVRAMGINSLLRAFTSPHRLEHINP